ncbi:TPA: hypothetical protein ACIPUI_001658 [Citrobacter freundii]
MENPTLHRTPFDYSPPAAHPSGASAASALFNAFGVSPGPGTTIQRTQPYGWVFAFGEPDSSSNYFCRGSIVLDTLNQEKMINREIIAGRDAA